MIIQIDCVLTCKRDLSVISMRDCLCCHLSAYDNEETKWKGDVSSNLTILSYIPTTEHKSGILCIFINLDGKIKRCDCLCYRPLVYKGLPVYGWIDVYKENGHSPLSVLHSQRKPWKWKMTQILKKISKTKCKCH